MTSYYRQPAKRSDSGMLNNIQCKLRMDYTDSEDTHTYTQGCGQSSAFGTIGRGFKSRSGHTADLKSANQQLPRKLIVWCQYTVIG